MLYTKNVWGALRDAANHDVWDTVGTGAPTSGTSGTGVGLTGPGSTYTDYTNSILYINTGTKASPTWTSISGASGSVTLNGVQTLTNKTLLDSTDVFANVTTPTKIIKFSLGGATAAKTMTLVSSHTDDRSLTLPDATDTLVGKATTDTLTNKTLTAPTITAPAITGSATIGTGATITTPTIAYGTQSVAAAGTNQTTAGAITVAAPGNVLVTAADSTKGVRLPAATAGLVYNLKNADVANTTLPVYPAVGETINAVATNGSLVMAAKTSAVYMCVTAGTWLTIPLVPS